MFRRLFCNFLNYTMIFRGTVFLSMLGLDWNSSSRTKSVSQPTFNMILDQPVGGGIPSASLTHNCRSSRCSTSCQYLPVPTEFSHVDDILTGASRYDFSRPALGYSSSVKVRRPGGQQHPHCLSPHRRSQSVKIIKLDSIVSGRSACNRDHVLERAH
jgi:hypothetical protein